jgi:hypothetical protein
MSNKNKAKATDATTPEPKAAEPKAAKPEAAPRFCACGCGIQTGKRTHWRQGHDARAKGWLQRVASGRCFEGEREAVIGLLERESAKAALSSEAFAPLTAAAKAAIAQTKAA